MAVKLNPTGDLYIDLEQCRRFSGSRLNNDNASESTTCPPGSDKDSTHSTDVDYYQSCCRPCLNCDCAGGPLTRHWALHLCFLRVALA